MYILYIFVWFFNSFKGSTSNCEQCFYQGLKIWGAVPACELRVTNSILHQGTCLGWGLVP